MLIQAYLFFNGRCEEAIGFYQRTLGAKTEMLMRYRDSPDPMPPGMIPPGSEEKVMHAAMRIGESLVMASDGTCSGSASFDGITLSLTVTDRSEAARVFAALSDGGQVRMPFGKTFFSPCFGMLADHFGVGWMVIVAAA